jgi:hypothetical protein
VSYCPGYGEVLAYGGGRYIDRCKALSRGATARECALEAFHKGDHADAAGVRFRGVVSGTSPRSHARTRIALREARLVKKRQRRRRRT